jgi:hypothetical protein
MDLAETLRRPEGAIEPPQDEAIAQRYAQRHHPHEVQQPMAFQVIAEAAERDIEVGRVRIEFHVGIRFEGAATQSLQTETGTMHVATPETTAFDLVRFPARCCSRTTIERGYGAARCQPHESIASELVGERSPGQDLDAVDDTATSLLAGNDMAIQERFLAQRDQALHATIRAVGRGLDFNSELIPDDDVDLVPSARALEAQFGAFATTVAPGLQLMADPGFEGLTKLRARRPHSPGSAQVTHDPPQSKNQNLAVVTAFRFFVRCQGGYVPAE